MSWRNTDRLAAQIAATQLSWQNAFQSWFCDCFSIAIWLFCYSGRMAPGFSWQSLKCFCIRLHKSSTWTSCTLWHFLHVAHFGSVSLVGRCSLKIRWQCEGISKISVKQGSSHHIAHGGICSLRMGGICMIKIRWQCKGASKTCVTWQSSHQ